MQYKGLSMKSTTNYADSSPTESQIRKGTSRREVKMLEKWLLNIQPLTKNRQHSDRSIASLIPNKKKHKNHWYQKLSSDIKYNFFIDQRKKVTKNTAPVT